MRSQTDDKIVTHCPASRQAYHNLVWKRRLFVRQLLNSSRKTAVMSYRTYAGNPPKHRKTSSKPKYASGSIVNSIRRANYRPAMRSNRFKTRSSKQCRAARNRPWKLTTYTNPGRNTYRNASDTTIHLSIAGSSIAEYLRRFRKAHTKGREWQVEFKPAKYRAPQT